MLAEPAERVFLCFMLLAHPSGGSLQGLPVELHHAFALIMQRLMP